MLLESQLGGALVGEPGHGIGSECENHIPKISFFFWNFIHCKLAWSSGFVKFCWLVCSSSLLGFDVCCFNHFMRSLVLARSFNIDCSSHKRYEPCFKVSRRNRASMALVKASANWAPVWTHRRLIPSRRVSLIALATHCTRNSEHCGGAVLVIKSCKLLQSVTAMSSAVGIVATVMAGSTFMSASSGRCHCVAGSWSHFQYNLNQLSWSRADAMEMVSAESVLVTTFWIFLLPQMSGLMGHSTFWEILMGAYNNATGIGVGLGAGCKRSIRKHHKS